MAPLAAGYALGRFTILGEVGRGGMAVVYKARQNDLGRIVALKVFNSSDGSGTGTSEHFNDEARLLARLSHPNIVQIFDIGEADGIRYIAMEYIDGPTLADCIGTERIDPERTLRMARSIAAALQYAHEHGVLHRDITPGNIKLRSDRATPVIMDFGLSRELTGEEGGTRGGLLMGTAAYMSPEQADGQPVDARSDVFSLGVVMYELLTHNNPFRAPEGLKQTVVNVLTHNPRPIRRLIPWIERDVETIVHKTLEKSRGNRYGTAADLAGDIDRYLEGEPIKARPASLLFRAYRRVRKHKVQAVVTLGLLLLLAGAVSGYYRMAGYRARQLRTVRIVHVQGDVRVSPATGPGSRRAEVGMILDGSHTVMTGPGASMTVMIGNTIKMVDENTRVEFNYSTVRGKEQIAVNTLFGTLLSPFDEYNPELRTIKVLTPGFNTEPEKQSSFNVHVEETGRSEIQVFRGNVVVDGGDTVIRVPGGNKMTAAGGIRGPLRSLTQEDLEAVRKRLSPDMFSRLLGGTVVREGRNSAPVFTTAPVAAAAAGSAYRMLLTAKDPDGDPVLYSLVHGPDGMRVEPFSGLLLWDAVAGGRTDVTIAASDNAGAVTELTFTLDGVSNKPPVPAIRTSAVSGTGRMTFLFDAAMTADETPESLRFRWDFNGDGKWEYTDGPGGKPQPVVEYTFPHEGRYRVIVEAVDPMMNAAVKRIDVWAGTACFADAGHDTAINLTGRVRYRGEGFSRVGTVIAFEWDFDGDGSVDRTLGKVETVYRSYDEPGTYRSTLTVRDDRGEYATDTVTVTVYDAPVRAAVEEPAVTVAAGAAAILAGSGTDPDGRITGYAWDFDGDGTVDWKSARTGRVTTRYRRPGVYKARLTVTAADGTAAHAVMEVTVTP